MFWTKKLLNILILKNFHFLEIFIFNKKKTRFFITSSNRFSQGSFICVDQFDDTSNLSLNENCVCWAFWGCFFVADTTGVLFLRSSWFISDVYLKLMSDENSLIYLKKTFRIIIKKEKKSIEIYQPRNFFFPICIAKRKLSPLSQRVKFEPSQTWLFTCRVVWFN